MRGQRTTDLYGWKSISPSTTFSLSAVVSHANPSSISAMHKSYYNYRCCRHCRGFGRTYLSADIPVAAVDEAAVIVYLSQLERQMLMMAEE